MGSYAAHLENQLAEARRIANERAAEASSQKATISSQSERIAALEAALRPFVALADSYFYRYETQPGVFRESHQDDPGDRAVYGVNRIEITTGDFRRARAALAPLGEE